MPDVPEQQDKLAIRLRQGDEQALAELSSTHRERLWRMIDFRLDDRLHGRLDPDDVLQEAYLDGIGVENPHVPNDPELPLLLNKVHPIHEVVKVDYFLPGCPPSADVFWKFLTDLIAGQEPSLPYELVHYD